ncbi:hypothetical protein TVAG_235450 [Trichomonas vaginalis G3]|uniref:Uncharacterized protein n=2 Tax=Trichomonas vaginalis (strain ATCC PRA-98 / G3) TaxID=412133 RepID=A2DPR3_TRIV3|nr:hypothetical protein TVAG_235450 [Trichomonas vaginalis G3]|eukprot:XP_001329798.1 hypothetical protein [Trichomonas vaginalis G3]
MLNYDDTNPELYAFLVSTKGILMIALAGLFVFLGAIASLHFLGQKGVCSYATVVLFSFFFIRHIVGENKVKMNHLKKE